MWKKALGFPLSDMNNMLAWQAIPYLEKALENMTQNMNEYLAMEPANGWGSFPGGHMYLVKLLHGCMEHPNAVIKVSY
jgi:hypothetical protein